MDESNATRFVANTLFSPFARHLDNVNIGAESYGHLVHLYPLFNVVTFATFYGVYSMRWDFRLHQLFPLPAQSLYTKLGTAALGALFTYTSLAWHGSTFVESVLPLPVAFLNVAEGYAY